MTTILDPLRAPAEELAALYHERWEIENTFDELKTHLRGRQIVLRSKTPELVRQEFYGFLLAHFAVRQLMHEAALSVAEDPDRLSFLHAVRVVRRKLSVWDAIPLWLANCYFAGRRACNIVTFCRRVARLELVVADFKGVRAG